MINKSFSNTFKSLFWIFWIFLGVLIVLAGIGFYLRAIHPPAVDVSDAPGILVKILVLIIGTVAFSSIFIVLFGVVLFAFLIYLLISLIIWIVGRILENTKRSKT